MLKAFAGFKLASKLGDPESYFFISLMNFYELDGTYILTKKLIKFYNSQHASPKFMKKKLYKMAYKFIAARAYRLSFINAYFSSVQGNQLSRIAIARKYLQGLGGIKQDCAKAILYYKDVAHIVATETTEINKYVEKHYLQKEIFNMNFNSFQYFKHQKSTLDEKLLFESISISKDKKYTPADLFRYLNGKYETDFNIEEFLTYAFTLPYEEKKTIASIVGYILYKGIRVEPDYKKAYDMFMLAANNKEAKG